MASSKSLIGAGASMATRLLNRALHTSPNPFLSPKPEFIAAGKLLPSLFIPQSQKLAPFHFPQPQNDVESLRKLSSEGFLYPCGLPSLPFLYFVFLAIWIFEIEARVRKVGLPAASRVPNLEQILIVSCGEIQEIFEDEDEDEERAVATTLPKLRDLWLEDLPRVKRVSKATIISNSIEGINITDCPELKNRLPLHFDGPVPPSSLKHIRVEREWWESLEWDNPDLPQLLHPLLISDDDSKDE